MSLDPAQDKVRLLVAHARLGETSVAETIATLAMIGGQASDRGDWATAEFVEQAIGLVGAWQ